MKVKVDFVSNSSSTSFVYIGRDMLSKEDFLTAAGVGAASPVAPLFESMFQQLQAAIERGEILTTVEQIESFENRDRFTGEVIDRMKTALQRGETVTIGKFSSEENLAESTLCTEIFEIESDRFFINAFENYW